MTVISHIAPSVPILAAGAGPALPPRSAMRPPESAALDDIERRLRTLLLRALDASDAAAYAEFLRQLGAHLRGYFRRRLFQWPDDVEDLVQECLLALHDKRHTYERDQPLTAWVHAIARYKMIDLLRARRVREALHDPLDDEMQLFACSATDASDARRDLAQLLATLPPRWRLPIEQVKLRQCSVVEAAQALGMSESAVKVGIHRGLKALARRVAQARGSR